jgi:hypothetical protein
MPSPSSCAVTGLADVSWAVRDAAYASIAAVFLGVSFPFASLRPPWISNLGNLKDENDTSSKRWPRKQDPNDKTRAIAKAVTSQ